MNTQNRKITICFIVTFFTLFLLISSCATIPENAAMFSGQWVRIDKEDNRIVIYDFIDKSRIKRDIYDNDYNLLISQGFSYHFSGEILSFIYGPRYYDDFFYYEIISHNIIRLKRNIYFENDGYNFIGYSEYYMNKLKEPFNIIRYGFHTNEEPADIKDSNNVIYNDDGPSSTMNNPSLSVEVLDPPSENQTAFELDLGYRRLKWSGGENTYRFQIVIEKLEDGKYVEHLKGFSFVKSFDVTLLPGEYRCCIIPHDVLDKPREGTPWMNFTIK